MPRSAVELITARKERFDETEAASTRLGGTVLWAADRPSLERGVSELESAILDASKAHLTVTRAVLKKLVTDLLDVSNLEDRVFSAVLGAVLRSASMDALVVGSKNDKPYRVYIHRAQIVRWYQACEKAVELSATGRVFAVRDLERLVFGARVYNSWSSSSHVLGHLGYRGLIEQVGDDSFCGLAYGNVPPCQP